QAEDGIRDRNVTGVQTCALPIFPPRHSGPPGRGPLPARRPVLLRRLLCGRGGVVLARLLIAEAPRVGASGLRSDLPIRLRRIGRSDERRVGTEGGTPAAAEPDAR